MTLKQRKIVVISGVLAILFGISPIINGMHIMEGYLPPKFCVMWGILCVPFLIAGFYSMKKIVSEHRKALLILAMAGGYAFVLSALKLPSVTGSSSHPTGTGLGAILFGPSVMSILGIMVLLFQAFLLAHGGLTTLGANTFSMAIAGPFLSFAIYRLGKKLNINPFLNVFLAAAMGDIFTYCVTSFQLALAYPSQTGGIGASLIKFLSIFAFTQVPLAIIEGIVTALVVGALYKYADSELKEIGYLGGAISEH